MTFAPLDPFHATAILAASSVCAIVSTTINVVWARVFVQRWRWVAGGCLAIWTLLSLDPYFADYVRLADWMPHVQWVRALGLLWAGIALASIGGRLIWRRSQLTPDKPRREFLRAAATTVAVTPFAAAGYGRYIAQRDPRIREVDVSISNLHPDLAGLRLVQISDLHMSDFVPRREIRRAVELANEQRPHLTFVTGDLITAAGDPLDDCIDELSLLRSDAGVFGCLGNHEIVAGAEDYTATRCGRAGIPILRGANTELCFGAARINLAGVDYQRRGSPYLAGAQSLISPGALNVLLSHNPDVFPIAARQGWDLTVAGHTHGGQVTLEYLHPALNPARFYTPYVYGMYESGKSRLYVNSGVGTIGVPVRLNTEPEIVCLRLRSA